MFNERKAIAYMYAYLGKSKESCSIAMKQVLKASIENRFGNCEQMTVITRPYSSNRECSVQEAVYHYLPES